ncbi:hypothetical protein, partial [Arcticibacter tournemirensis]
TRAFMDFMPANILLLLFSPQLLSLFRISFDGLRKKTGISDQKQKKQLFSELLLKPGWNMGLEPTTS